MPSVLSSGPRARPRATSCLREPRRRLPADAGAEAKAERRLSRARSPSPESSSLNANEARLLAYVATGLAKTGRGRRRRSRCTAIPGPRKGPGRVFADAAIVAALAGRECRSPRLAPKSRRRRLLPGDHRSGSPSSNASARLRSFGRSSPRRARGAAVERRVMTQSDRTELLESRASSAAVVVGPNPDQLNYPDLEISKRDDEVTLWVAERRRPTGCALSLRTRSLKEWTIAQKNTALGPRPGAATARVC